MDNFIIETSARHVHVTREALDILFGKGFELEVKKPLSQPGQYASNQKVEVVGPKSSLKCSILGPVRPQNQVELSFTDARTLGIVAPIRESGDVAGSAPCKIVGPCGELDLKEGAIIALRHVHMTPADAERFGSRLQRRDDRAYSSRTQDRFAGLRRRLRLQRPHYTTIPRCRAAELSL